MTPLRVFLFALTILALSACVSIGAFNRATPHDEGVVVAARSEAYGEGPRRTLDVYVGEIRPRQPLPVVIFFYGGGWSSGAKEDHSFVGHAFASRGFVTMVPDYRVYPEVTYPAFVEDAAAAIKWTQDNAPRFGGDPTRIVIVGHSAGAHIALLAALDPRNARAAGFDPSAIRGLVGLAAPYGFETLDNPMLRNVFGPNADVRAVSPITYVWRDGPALLLLSGDRDRRVPLSALRHMERDALAAGQMVESKVYPGLDHPGILQALAIARRDEAPVLADVTAFARLVTEP